MECRIIIYVFSTHYCAIRTQSMGISIQTMVVRCDQPIRKKVDLDWFRLNEKFQGKALRTH